MCGGNSVIYVTSRILILMIIIAKYMFIIIIIFSGHQGADNTFFDARPGGSAAREAGARHGAAGYFFLSPNISDISLYATLADLIFDCF